MNPKYQKVLSDIEKAEKKKSEIEGQLKELYDKKTELENLEIINTVRSMVMDKDQIMAFLSSMKGGTKPAENTDTGTASSAAASSSSSEQQQENTLTGSLDEKKNGMFVVTDAEGASYEFTYDPSDTPKGLDDVAEGDSVTVTYTGTVSEVDSFDGTIVSVEKAEAAQN